MVDDLQAQIAAAQALMTNKADRVLQPGPDGKLIRALQAVAHIPPGQRMTRADVRASDGTVQRDYVVVLAEVGAIRHVGGQGRGALHHYERLDLWFEVAPAKTRPRGEEEKQRRKAAEKTVCTWEIPPCELANVLGLNSIPRMRIKSTRRHVLRGGE